MLEAKANTSRDYRTLPVPFSSQLLWLIRSDPPGGIHLHKSLTSASNH